MNKFVKEKGKSEMKSQNNKLRRRVVRQAVSEKVTDISLIRQRIADQGLPPATDEWIRSVVKRTIQRNYLKKICRTPNEALRFRDFARLRSGWDRYSSIRLPELRQLVPKADLKLVSTEIQQKQQASCLRWILRGLPIEKAIRKVKVDAEITACAWDPGDDQGPGLDEMG